MFNFLLDTGLRALQTLFNNWILRTPWPTVAPVLKHINTKEIGQKPKVVKQQCYGSPDSYVEILTPSTSGSTVFRERLFKEAIKLKGH